MGRLSFRKKLTIIFLITAIIEGALIGGFSFSHSEKIVVENKKNEMADTINRIDININVKVRYMMEMIENVVTGQMVKDIFFGKEKPNDSVKREYLEEYCKNLSRSMEAVSGISIMKGRDIIYTTDSSGASKNETQAKLYYSIAKQNPEKTVWTGITPGLYRSSAVPAKEVVTVIRAITDESQQCVVGAIVVELESATFSNLLLSNQGIFQYQYTVIVDKMGEVICSNKKVDTSWLAEIDDFFERGIRKFDFEWKGKQYFVCGQYNGVTGWKTYSIISLSDLFPQSKLLKNSIMLAVIASTLAVSAVIAAIAYTITKPINLLSDAMYVVQKGNFEVQVPNHRKDEIGRLTDSFNYMVNQINTLIKQVYQEKIAQKNAELKALQAQINPHFLYNTLDSINWMLIDKGEDEISDVIISLGALMRYCIDDNSTFVTLEQEFQYVLSYLCIQKNRLEERLQYETKLPDALKWMEVPKLILQPLVENAITHGIEQSSRSGSIKITAYDDKEQICIMVEDNGIGMTLEQITNLDKKPDVIKEGHTGIGLRNVDKRIRLHYGDQYRLKIESKQGEGTRISVFIPKKIQGDHI